MAVFNKKNVMSEMETGRELIHGVINQFETWRETIVQGVVNLSSHKSKNEKTIKDLTIENQTLAKEIESANGFKKKIEELMGEANLPNKKGE